MTEKTTTTKVRGILDVHSQLLGNLFGGEGVRSVECGRSIAIARVWLVRPLGWCSMRFL